MRVRPMCDWGGWLEKKDIIVRTLLRKGGVGGFIHPLFEPRDFEERGA